MKTRRIAFIFIVLLFTGCEAAKMIYDMINAPEDADYEYAAEYPMPEPTERPTFAGYGGSLNLSMRLPKTLNPILNEDATVDTILSLMFEPLFILDENLKVVPNIAESIYFAEDGQSAVVTLRNDVYWNDGSSVTTHDLTYTIDELRRAPDGSVYKQNVRIISDYIRINDREARLFFHEYSASIMYDLCFPLIPEHYYRGGSRDMEPLGNGPYVFESYKGVTELKLTANGDYFKHEPYISSITVLVTADRETDIHAFEQGVVDVISSVFSEQGKYGGKKAINTTVYISSYFDFIGFNYNNDFFHDHRVRAAIARCVDIDEIINAVYVGYAKRAHSPFNPASWLYGESIRTVTYDPDEAATVFNWLANPDELNGLTVLVNIENEERVVIADMLSENLAAAGFGVSVDKVDFTAFNERIESNDFDILIAGAYLPVIPDLGFLLGQDGNIFAYEDAEMDELLSGLSDAENEQDFMEYALRIQRYIADETVMIGLAFREYVLLTDARVSGGIKPVMNGIYANIHEWFIH